MAPRIEGVENSNGQIDCFSIDLQNSELFNVELFEELAKRVDYRSGIQTSMLKYLVVSERMWIFSETQAHFGFYTKLKSIDQNANLQSAGAISIRYYSPGLQESLPRRKIYNWSSSLVPDLEKAVSDKYKFSEIVNKLGEHFKVE